jgi:hypothetical protein
MKLGTGYWFGRTAKVPSERLSAQVLLSEGFEDLDPSHPLGGQDGGRDAIGRKDGKRWIMGVYFPRGQQDFRTIKDKFLQDLKGVLANRVDGMVFVTNQGLRLAERKELREAAALKDLELYHLGRITAVLDKPEMTSVRTPIPFH